MNVPITERQVAIEPVQTGERQIQPITPAASGANIGEAVSGLGKTIEKVGTEAAQIVAEERRIAAENNVFNKFVQFSAQHADIMHSVDPQTGQLNLDPKTNKPTGVMDRMGADTAGASAEYEVRTTALIDKSKQELGSRYEQRMFDQFARRTVMYGIDHVKTHESSQARLYRAQSGNAAINGISETAALTATIPDSLYDYATRASAIALHLAHDEGVQDPNMLDMRKREAADRVVSNSIAASLENDPQRAKDFISDDGIRSIISVETLDRLEKAVDGKFMDTTANALLADPAIRKNRDGSPDLEDVKTRIDALPDFTQEKKDKILDLYEKKNAEADYILNSENKAITKKFHSLASDPSISMDAANKLAHSMAEKLRDGSIDNDDVRQKLKYVLNVRSASKGFNDPDTQITLWRGIQNGDITKAEPINEAYEAGLLSKPTYVSMTKELLRGKSEIMRNAWATIERNLADDVPDRDEQKQFLSSLHLQATEKNITDPVALQELADKNLKTVKTGATKLFGLINASGTYSSVANVATRNLSLSKAAGGVDKTVSLIQRLGGPEKFEADSPQSIAVTNLLGRGWQPDDITRDVLDRYLKKYPNGK